MVDDLIGLIMPWYSLRGIKLIESVMRRKPLILVKRGRGDNSIGDNLDQFSACTDKV